MYANNKSNSTSHICEIGGKRYYYDACAETANGITADCYVYIGSGTIYSVKDAPYKSERMFHFWRYNDRALIEAR